MQNCSIYLASQSPRRKEILERAGIRFTVCESTYEEGGLCLPPAALVEELSKGKAMQAVVPEEDCLIIGADTVVSLDNQILGKPADEEDAFRILRLLSGRSSLVYTGVFLLKKGKDAFAEGFHTVTEVCIDELSDSEILSYIRTGEPMDKAGAYAIQGIFGKHIKGIVGDYYNVMGLPVNELYRRLVLKNIISL
ncbi:MAG: septum formation protein Maf [Lachnospiraceae bacterium]|nr:septum formation protein Maf [Lachnospiraceae bacterium]